MRAIIAACLVALLIAAGAYAQDSTGSRVVIGPDLPHAHDDRIITLGGTRGTPDVTIQWETADASDHNLSLGVTGSSDAVISQDLGIDWGITGTNALRVQSADSGSPTEYFRARHDGTNAKVSSGSGEYQIMPASDILRICDSGAACSQFLDGSAGGGSAIALRAAATIMTRISADASADQLLVTVNDGLANHMILSDEALGAADYLHGDEGDPVLYLQGRTDPTGDADRWLSLGYRDDASEQYGALVTGEGNLRLDPAANVVMMPGTESDGIEIVASEVQTTDGAATTCVTVALADENTYHLTGTAVGVKSDGSARASYKIHATVYRTAAGAATQQGSSTVAHTAESAGGLDADFAVSGNNALWQVTGVNPDTYEWACDVTIANTSN